MKNGPNFSGSGVEGRWAGSWFLDIIARLIRTDLEISSSVGTARVELTELHLQIADFSRGFAAPSKKVFENS